jgi:eukaryotic-like serine/threonine-protein kinase
MSAAPDDRPDDTADLPDDPRLMRAVEEYLGELESGRRPDRREFLRRYPDIAGPLAECLGGLELVHRAAVEDKAPRVNATDFEVGEGLPANPLGDFKIVREIGRGGMGVVYEAVQLSLGRRVALKVLPFAAAFDARHLQRFHNEAQAAAQLHHTNIVPVYAVGSERGVHFYAMQLIDGQSLAAVIRQMRRHAGRPDGEDAAPAGRPAEPASDMDTLSQVSLALSTQRSGRRAEFFRAAARLIVQAADALEHAHQFGIVHRDIKPANLLVDAHGRLWITDFGVAQFHAAAGLTQTGEVPGTLRYMSPEQASGQRVVLDHRTDVYSLGATLYELVSLEPIFPGQDRRQVLSQLISDDPRPPRAIDAAVPVELETIVLKAVAKNPAERYGSAREFAADLQRFLEDKPILARRPSLVDRVRKWSRRHPAVVAAGVLLLLVCIAGLVVNNRMISAEQAKTAAALDRERDRFRQARQAVDLLVQVSVDELANAPQLQSARRRLLETALAYYQDFLDQQQGDADAQAGLADARKRVRSLLDDLATLQGAGQLVWVRDPDVQKALELTDEQRERIDRLGAQLDRLGMARGRRGGFGPEPPDQQFLRVARENEKALAEILTPQQFVRFRQVAIQLQGPIAFHDSKIMDDLKLTPDQRKRIRELRDAAMPWGRGGPPPFDGDPGHRRQVTMEQELDQILALLTPEQMKRWRDLTGEPLERPIRFRPPGPGGPGFGPGGPPGPPGGRGRGPGGPH